MRAASVVLGVLLLLPLAQQKGCEQKKGGAGGGSEYNPVLAEREAQREIEGLRVALESKQVGSVMRHLDPTGLDAYAAFEDQVTQLLTSTSELRLFFRVSNIQMSPRDRKPILAQAQVDAEMVYFMKNAPKQEVRRRERLQLDLAYDSQTGWRFVRISPRTFFTPRTAAACGKGVDFREERA